METNKTKYDTNPLDPDYVRETEEVWGEGSKEEAAPETDELWGATATRPVTQPPPENPRANVYSEAPTRTFDTPTPQAPYPSVFVPPTYTPPVQPYHPSAYQSSPVGQAPSCRPVGGIGLPEKWAVMLPYAPLYIGVVVSLIELFLIPRKEVKVRFHAAQALSLHIAILAISTLFGIVGAITNSGFGGALFKVAATVFLVISMIRVWRGEPHRIAPLAEPSQWFNEHIEPRKPS